MWEYQSNDTIDFLIKYNFRGWFGLGKLNIFWEINYKH